MESIGLRMELTPDLREVDRVNGSYLGIYNHVDGLRKNHVVYGGGMKFPFSGHYSTKWRR